MQRRLALAAASRLAAVTTFALVHGAWHGGWCWERLIPELEALGHRAVAMDLPSDDPEASFSTYADAVVDAIADEPDDTVVVGHSLAGHTIPLVADRRTVGRLVFLCALIAEPGRSFRDQLETEPEMILNEYESGMSEVDEQARRRWIDYEPARENLYADCDEADARAAFERLRPQALAPYAQPCQLQALTPCECTYVVGSEDRLVNPDWSRRAAKQRLGVEPAEFASSHSPFLSRPADLARLLDQTA